MGNDLWSLQLGGFHTHLPFSLWGFQDWAVSTSHQGVIKGTTEKEAGSEWEQSSSACRVISSMASVYLVVGTEILGGKITRRKQQFETRMKM